MFESDEKRISSFVRRHHVMALAVVSGGEPWCCSLFYACDASARLLVFASDTATRHGDALSSGGLVAGAIALETRVIGRVRGLQLQGELRRAEGDELAWARHVYLKRFPYAAAYPLTLWILQPSLMKLTDNRLGFGKKIIWKRG